MSAAHLLRSDEQQPKKRIRVCTRCGMEKPCERENGQEICACCAAAINAGDRPRVGPYTIDDV